MGEGNKSYFFIEEEAASSREKKTTRRYSQIFITSLGALKNLLLSDSRWTAHRRLRGYTPYRDPEMLDVVHLGKHFARRIVDESSVDTAFLGVPKLLRGEADLPAGTHGPDSNLDHSHPWFSWCYGEEADGTRDFFRGPIQADEGGRPRGGGRARMAGVTTKSEGKISVDEGARGSWHRICMTSRCRYVSDSDRRCIGSGGASARDRQNPWSFPDMHVYPPTTLNALRPPVLSLPATPPFSLSRVPPSNRRLSSLFSRRGLLLFDIPLRFSLYD